MPSLLIPRPNILMILISLILAGVIGYFLLAGSGPGPHQDIRDASIKTLKEGLENANPYVRSAAAKAIGDSQNPGLLPWVLAAFSDDDPTVRLFAVETASIISGVTGAKILEKGLEDPNFSVRLTTARVLSHYSGPNRERLFKKAAKDSESLVGMMALSGKTGSEGSVLPPDLLRQFERILQMGSIQEKMVAASAMGKTKSPAVIPILGKLIRAEDASLRGISARAMGESGMAASLPFLHAAVKDPSPEVRSEAFQAIGKLDLPGTLAILETGITDSDELVRLSAGLGLLQRGRVEYEPSVGEALGNADFGIRSSAARSLGELSLRGKIVISDDLFFRLRRGLSDPSERVRSATSRAMGMTGRLEGIASLSQLLGDPDPSVRCYAAGGILAILGESKP
ncbi:MAG TPA: HEAT repeat domain-containing protein [Nitrospiria bacterium]|nr:HEAT repeat domain-containing protein [Nitrospiria bacterium]